MIELILQVTLFINGLFLSGLGRAYIHNPQNHTQWRYKNKVLDGPSLELVDIVGEFLKYVMKLSDIFFRHLSHQKRSWN